MRSSRRAALALVGAVLVVVSAAAVMLRIESSRHPVDTANVYSGNLAAVGIAITLLVATGTWWRKGRPQAEAGVSTSAQVTAAAERLAEVMADRWRQEAARRRIITPAPATIRWRWAAGDVASSRLEVTASPAAGTGPPPLPTLTEPGAVLGSGVVSRLHDELYARLPHGRLVILGGPGAGKTGAMILLLLAALDHRSSLAFGQRERVPVPVWLTVGRWDPAATSLREWAAATMNRDHPALRAAEYGPDAAVELLRSGRVALFLDGLDEMPEGVRAQALQRVDDEARGLRVVVTSRAEEFREALQDGGPNNTAVIELQPVRLAAAVAYLLHGQTGASREQWEGLGAFLKRHPGSVVARALDNPLTLSAARDAYAGHDPLVLTELSRFPDVQAVREHLLNQLLANAYPDRRQRVHATHWLAWIAGQLSASRDLPWWEIPGWVPLWKLRASIGLVGGLLFGLAVGFAAGHQTGRIPGLVTGIAAGAVFGLLLFAYYSSLRYFQRDPRAFTPRWPRLRDLGLIVELGLRTGLVIGFTVWVAAGLAVLLGAGPAVKAGPGLVFAFAAGFVLGLAVGLTAQLGFVWTTPVAAWPSATATSTYRADRWTSVLGGLVVGGLAGVMAGLALGPLVGLVTGFGAGMLLGLVSTQASMMKLVEIILSLQEGSRVNFYHLLEDALDRQLLRQAGAVYQFRHAALQDYLVATSCNPSLL